MQVLMIYQPKHVLVPYHYMYHENSATVDKMCMDLYFAASTKMFFFLHKKAWVFFTILPTYQDSIAELRYYSV
jgi:hypothetical protein